MLSLIIADRGDAMLPDPRDPFVQIWRDYQGEACAYAYRLNGDYWLHIPRVASYCFSKTTTEITAFPEGSVSHARVKDLFSRVVFPIALHARGIEVLHASAVLSKAGVIAFCAMADTGKSTTAYALSRRGYKQWADDAVPFEIKDRQVTAVPHPFMVRLDPDAEEYLGKWEPSKKTSFEEFRTRLAALFVLKRSSNPNEEEISIDQFSAAEAFRAVLLHGHFFNLKTTELMKQMVSNYLKLTSLIPVYQVHFKPGFDKLPVLLDHLEQTFEKLSCEIS
jgi:hypothetical protein